MRPARTRGPCEAARGLAGDEPPATDAHTQGTSSTIHERSTHDSRSSPGARRPGCARTGRAAGTSGSSFGCPRAADGRRDRRGRLHPASGLGARHRSSAWATPRWSSTTPRPNWAPPATSSRSVSAPTRTCPACSPRAAEVCWPVPGRARSSSTTERGRRSAAGTWPRSAPPAGAPTRKCQ